MCLKVKDSQMSFIVILKLFLIADKETSLHYSCKWLQLVGVEDAWPAS